MLKATEAFDKCKQNLAETTSMAYPRSDVPLVIVSDASHYAPGPTLQSRVGDNLQPLAFLLSKLSISAKKYYAYVHELLAMYAAIKHFQHMVEGHQFTVFRSHWFLSSSENWISVPLDSSGTLTSSSSSARTSAIFLDPTILSPTHYLGSFFVDLACSQEKYVELQRFLEFRTALQLTKMPILGTTATLYCSVSTSTAKPFITAEFRKVALDPLYQLSQPGANVTVKLVTQRFVWTHIKADCRWLSQKCVARPVSASPGSFNQQWVRFEDIHIDILEPWPVSKGYRYAISSIDRFTRRPEVFSVTNIKANTVSRMLYAGWILRLRTPLRIIIDQRRQFKSKFSRELNSLISCQRIRNYAYYPQANSMV